MKTTSSNKASAKPRTKSAAPAPIKGKGARLGEAQNAQEKAKKRRSPEKKSELGG
jgi:hypothetical protein